jgi:hypothetical protein
MKALMPRRTTRSALALPIAAPTASAIPSDTGKLSHAGSSVKPPPAPPVPKMSAMLIAASAITDSIERSMWPAISVSDRPTAMMPTKVDCSRMLRKMPICRKFRIVAEDRSDDDQDDQTRLSRRTRSPARGGSVSAGWSRSRVGMSFRRQRCHSLASGHATTAGSIRGRHLALVPPARVVGICMGSDDRGGHRPRHDDGKPTRPG